MRGITLLACFTSVFADGNDPRDFDSDLLMPGFHFVPFPWDWQNDPNGPMWDPVHEKYHLFYQYQTPRMWGHAVSDDLVDWVQLPMALKREHWYDQGGDFSGSATVLDDDASTVVLTVSSSDNTEIFVALPEDRSDPYLTNWTLPDYNPIYTTDARDPTEIMKTSKGTYRIADGTAVGTEIWEVNAFEDIFTNDTWTKIGTFQSNDGGAYWECPDVFPLPGAEEANLWVSKYSRSGDHYYLGMYDEDAATFTPLERYEGNPKTYDHGTFYASKTFLDKKDDASRRVLWGWQRMDKPEDTWQGQTQGVPREVKALPVTGSNKVDESPFYLTNFPIKELETLRDEDSHVANALPGGAQSFEIHDDEPVLLDAVSGRMLDMKFDIDYLNDGAQACGIRVLWTPGSDEYTDVLIDQRWVRYRATKNIGCWHHHHCFHSPRFPRLSVKQERKNYLANSHIFICLHSITTHRFAPYSLALTENNVGTDVNFRVLVDSSIIEVFINFGEETQTLFSYPTTSTSVSVGLIGAHCVFHSFESWNMNPYHFDASLVM